MSDLGPKTGGRAHVRPVDGQLQNRCPLLQHSLMFDPVQAPSLRHAFELVNATIFEADSRL
jgi:hypothetical protein